MLYWTTRLALVVAWLLVAWRAFGRRSAWPGLAVALALASALFASFRALRWNFAALEAARAALRSVGAYDGRIWWKLALAVALVGGGALVWRRARRAAPEPRAVLCVAALLLQAALIGIETLSLDDALPRWLADQPGRYLTEGSFAALALWALRPAGSAR